MSKLDDQLERAKDNRASKRRCGRGPTTETPGKPKASHPWRLSMWRRGSRKGGT